MGHFLPSDLLHACYLRITDLKPVEQLKFLAMTLSCRSNPAHSTSKGLLLEPWFSTPSELRSWQPLQGSQSAAPLSQSPRTSGILGPSWSLSPHPHPCRRDARHPRSPPRTLALGRLFLATSRQLWPGPPLSPSQPSQQCPHANYWTSLWSLHGIPVRLPPQRAVLNENEARLLAYERLGEQCMMGRREPTSLNQL